MWCDRAAYARRLSTELAHLIPYLDRGLQQSTTRVASVVVATAHNRVAHGKDCNVQAHRLPLTALVSDKGVVQSGHPCPACVRKRAHHVASELFCRHFESQCAAATTQSVVKETPTVAAPGVGAEEDEAGRTSAATVARRVPARLTSDILASYASLEAFYQDVVLFACSGQSPGRTWLVYRPPTGRKLPIFGKGVQHRVMHAELPHDSNQQTHEMAGEGATQGEAARRATGDGAAVESALPLGSLQSAEQSDTPPRAALASEHDRHKDRRDGDTAPGAGRIYVLNLSSNEVPLVHGLWPLAVINMTETILCAAVVAEQRATTGRDTDIKLDGSACSHGTKNTTAAAPTTHQPPWWSRAARLAKSPSSLLPWQDSRRAVTSAMVPTLESIRESVVRRALSTMNWSFVDEQLALAKAYYDSHARQQSQADRRAVQEREVVAQALRRVQLEADLTPAAETRVGGGSGAAAAIRASAVLSTRGETKAGEGGGDDGGTAVKLPTSQGATPHMRASEAEGVRVSSDAQTTLPTATHTGESRADAKEREEKEQRLRHVSAMPASAQQDAQPSSGKDRTTSPRTVQRSDGTWEYIYPNGNVTLVMLDGTKVFREANGMRTTVYSDGSTLFEYTNHTSILDRTDGVRITTFADGTTKEERITR